MKATLISSIPEYKALSKIKRKVIRIGAYARYYLAWHHKKSGEEQKASKLFSELSEEYPHAIDHKGNLLSELIEK